MIFLQAGIAFGFLLMVILALLVFIVFPICVILFFIRGYKRLKQDGIEWATKEKLAVGFQSLVKSLSIIIIIGIIIFMVLYLTVDLTIS